MIHQLLNLTRPLFCVDCETTGTDVKTDRIVSLGFEMWTAEGLKRAWKTLVNPGVPIPPASTKVHGITDEMMSLCAECGDALEHPRHGPSQGDHPFHAIPPFRGIAKSLAAGFSDCDFCGKNCRFDLRIIDAEMRRAGVAWSYAGARIIDAERLEQLAIPRTLSHLYKKYTGKDLDGAHDALMDVKASTVVIAAQLETHASLPRDLDALHEEQWKGWLDSEGAFRYADGVATCQFGKYRGKAMTSIPVDYYDWILKNDFASDVKSLASQAKLGRFPEEQK